MKEETQKTPKKLKRPLALISVVHEIAGKRNYNSFVFFGVVPACLFVTGDGFYTRTLQEISDIQYRKQQSQFETHLAQVRQHKATSLEPETNQYRTELGMLVQRMDKVWVIGDSNIPWGIFGERSEVEDLRGQMVRDGAHMTEITDIADTAGTLAKTAIVSPEAQAAEISADKFGLIAPQRRVIRPITEKVIDRVNLLFAHQNDKGEMVHDTTARSLGASGAQLGVMGGFFVGMAELFRALALCSKRRWDNYYAKNGSPTGVQQ